MPTVYNGGQSQLEYYAINGNVSVNGGLGRPVLTNQTTLKYGASFKNPEITQNPNDKYDVGHTNAIGDAQTPFRGKGTMSSVDVTNTYNGYIARNNYNGGDGFDINGGDTAQAAGYSKAGLALGRNNSVILNVGTWGYGPDVTNGGADTNWYKHPDISGNLGQVII
jgi:hypothetical protein